MFFIIFHAFKHHYYIYSLHDVYIIHNRANRPWYTIFHCYTYGSTHCEVNGYNRQNFVCLRFKLTGHQEAFFSSSPFASESFVSRVRFIQLTHSFSTSRLNNRGIKFKITVTHLLFSENSAANREKLGIKDRVGSYSSLGHRCGRVDLMWAWHCL